MDSYITVKELSEYHFEDRKSEFIGFAKPVSTEEDALQFIQSVKKQYPDARHWVYAYVLRENSTMRFTDDREPQGTAGMPVLDVIRKNGVTDTVIVVVRYFGGTKLGVSGLIQAYKESTADVIAVSKIIEKTVDRVIRVDFSYISMNGVMRIIKEMSPRIDEQVFDNLCTMKLRIRESEADMLIAKLEKVEGVIVEIVNE